MILNRRRRTPEPTQQTREVEPASRKPQAAAVRPGAIPFHRNRRQSLSISPAGAIVTLPAQRDGRQFPKNTGNHSAAAFSKGSPAWTPNRGEAPNTAPLLSGRLIAPGAEQLAQWPTAQETGLVHLRTVDAATLR